MATINRTSSKRKPYQVRWRDPSGKQRKKSFSRRVDADRFRTEVEHQVQTGSYVDAAAGRQTLRTYGETWRRAQPVRPNTADRHERDCRLHIYPALGDRPIAAIRASEVQAWLTGLAQKMSPNSARVTYGTLRAIFTSAKRDRILGFDPCDDVKLPEIIREEVWPLTTEQVELLADLIDPRYRALVVLGAGCGLRQGEAFGVAIEAVDFLRKREIAIVQQVQVQIGVGTVLVPVKSRTSRRTIPAADAVLAELTEHLRLYRHATSPLMFTTPAGKMLHRSMFNEGVWHPARAAAADVFRQRATAERDPDRAALLARRADQLATCGMHDLRHYFASALIRYGLDAKTVSVRMGHSSPSVTLSVYSHLWDDAEDRTRAAIDAAFGHQPGGDVPQMRPGDLGGVAPSQVRTQ